MWFCSTAGSGLEEVRLFSLSLLATLGVLVDLNRSQKDQIGLFIGESNAIEGFFDSDSYNQALKAWKSLAKRRSLTLDGILQAHLILTQNHDLPQHQKGRWRTCQVMIGGKIAKPWYAVPELMAQWIIQYRGAKTEERIKQAHIAFEHIHPFIDGNGRIGRMILNYQRLKAKLPVLVIKEVEKYDYYEWFRGEDDYPGDPVLKKLAGQSLEREQVHNP